jgi:hypothetical protein
MAAATRAVAPQIPLTSFASGLHAQGSPAPTDCALALRTPPTPNVNAIALSCFPADRAIGPRAGPW